MPHEHINSSLVPLLPDGRSPERVVVSWTKPNHVVPGRDGRPEPGSVQLSSEWLVSEARWPSPRVIEIDPDAPHAFNAADDSNECRWCDRTQTDGPHGIIDPTKTHLFRGDPDGPARGNTRCVHCDQTYVAGPHASATAERDVALLTGPRVATHVDHSNCDHPATVAGRRQCREQLEADVPDPRPAPRGQGTGNPTIPHFYAPTAGPDPDPDMDPCDFCGLEKHDSDAAHMVKKKRKVITEGEPTWSEPCTGFNVTLSREDINYLIGRLRRARDEAYGGDA